MTWRSLKDDPPPKDARGFWVGHSEGGRMEYVFRWPNGKGELEFWQSTPLGNVKLSFVPDVWYPGPPPIPGSWVASLHDNKPT